MDQMRELITVEAFDRALLAAAAIWLVVWLAVAALRRRAGAVRLQVLLALLGPVAFGLWKYYAWTVRVDPETGYVGLHRVSVFVVDALVFVVCGCLIGYLAGRLHNHGGKSEG